MVGKRLRELRNERGISQDQLAFFVKASKTSISNYENDIRVPDIDLAINMAELFNVSLDYLAGKSNVKSQNDVLYNNFDKLQTILNINSEEELLDIFNELAKLIILADTQNIRTNVESVIIQFFDELKKIIYSAITMKENSVKTKNIIKNNNLNESDAQHIISVQRGLEKDFYEFSKKFNSVIEKLASEFEKT